MNEERTITLAYDIDKIWAMSEKEEYEIKVRSWRRSDKFSCPKCGKKLGIENDYFCKECNIKLQIMMQF